MQSQEYVVFNSAPPCARADRIGSGYRALWQLRQALAVGEGPVIVHAKDFPNAFCHPEPEDESPSEISTSRLNR
jgi:hypothetical protein